MPGRVNQFDHMAAITKVIEVAPHALALRAHVRQIIESSAFRGSRRSQEFLQFIVDRALDGQFDDLKERALGVELFGRAPSYNTGDDSIVRVTARDVRKRLNQFYTETGFNSEFRVELPPGSYIPEFRNMPLTIAAEPEAPEPARVLPLEPPNVTQSVQAKASRSLGLAAVTFLLGAALGGLVLWFWSGRHAGPATVAEHTLPWSALVRSSQPLHVIFCDPDIVNIQRLLNSNLSLSEYANQRYWPNSKTQQQQEQSILKASSFRGANVASVDADIALKVASLLGLGGKFAMNTYTARSLRLADFKTNDNFVILGSPRSNPWFDLFEDELDFTFGFDNVNKSEFIRNKHPRKGEASIFVPTAQGWGTGQAYAIIALVGNPDQKGQVLLVAGTSAEATAASGNLVTSLDLLPGLLKSHGIDPDGAPRYFELLLKVSTMAGSPNTFEVLACHTLSRNGPLSPSH